MGSLLWLGKNWRQVLLVALWVGSLVWAWSAAGDRVQARWDMAEAKRTARDAKEELQAFREGAARLGGLAADVQAKVDALASKTNNHIVEYRTHEKLVPLPADCRIDDGRLRLFQSAVQDVNAAIVAAQSGHAGAAAGAAGIE